MLRSSFKCFREMRFQFHSIYPCDIKNISKIRSRQLCPRLSHLDFPLTKFAEIAIFFSYVIWDDKWTLRAPITNTAHPTFANGQSRSRSTDFSSAFSTRDIYTPWLNEYFNQKLFFIAYKVHTRTQTRKHQTNYRTKKLRLGLAVKFKYS